MKRATISTIILALSGLTPQSATAQTVSAHRGGDGRPWCSANGATLTQLADGGFEGILHLRVEETGQQTTNVPGAGVNFHGAPAIYHASVEVTYRLAISATGQPDMPQPYRIEVTSPGHVGPIPAPVSAYRLQVTAGPLTSPILNDTYTADSGALQLFASMAPADQANPKQTAMPAAELRRLVTAFEANGATILVLRNGKEVARTVLPGTAIPDQSKRLIQWLGTNIPLLKQGQCSA